MEKQEKKKKSTLSKVISIVVDILVVPVIIIAFACTILTFSAKANNRVPQIFGKSIVTVLTSSMEPDYKVGDVLIINKINNLDSLKIGDNIAFYAPIWLGSPFTTTLSNGEKVSNVIYHQIVDIIYPKNSKGKPVRHFVCRGINLSPPDYEFVGEGQGEYELKEDGTYSIKKGGGYDIVLENMPLGGDITGDDATLEDIEKSMMSTMQYVTDEYVVGKYDSSLSSVVGGFIKFASSTSGLIIMVIVPATIMLAFVIAGLVKDVKASKEEEEEDQFVLQANVSKLKEASSIAKEERMETSSTAHKKQDETNVEELDMASVISGAMASLDANKLKEEPKEIKETKNVTDGSTETGNTKLKNNNNETKATTKEVKTPVPKKTPALGAGKTAPRALESKEASTKQVPTKSMGTLNSATSNNSAGTKKTVPAKKVPITKVPPKKSE